MQITTISKDLKDKEVKLKDLLAKSNQTLLYFYPKDNTPGCSLEARDFSLHLDNFIRHGIQVIGVSRDSVKSHISFIQKQCLNLELISDPDLILHKTFGAWGEKKNYGKVFEGTIRSTFLLNHHGEFVKERRNVKATGHVERIMKELGIVQNNS